MLNPETLSQCTVYYRTELNAARQSDQEAAK